MIEIQQTAMSRAARHGRRWLSARTRAAESSVRLRQNRINFQRSCCGGCRSGRNLVRRSDSPIAKHVVTLSDAGLAQRGAGLHPAEVGELGQPSGPGALARVVQQAQVGLAEQGMGVGIIRVDGQGAPGGAQRYV